MLWLILTISLLGLIYYYITKPFKYWTNKGVKQGSPIPIFGDSWRTLVKKQSFAEFVQYVYDMCPESPRYSGAYQFILPFLVLKDPDLIKQITIKDFEHFLDHRTYVSEEHDPLWGKTLLALQGQKWRIRRATLSPAFTSSKMKQMFVLISEAAEQFVNYFLLKRFVEY